MARSLGSKIRTTLDDNRCDCRAIDVCKRLGRKYDRRVLLAQGLQPLTELAGKVRIIKSEPALIDDEQRWPPIKARLDPVKEIRQDCRCNGGADQSVGLKDLNGGSAEAFILGIEQSVIGTAETIGL